MDMEKEQKTDVLMGIKTGVSAVLASPFFAIFLGVVAIVGYYAQCDLFSIWMVLGSAILMMIFCKDFSPVCGMLLFMNILTSPTNSDVDSSYFMGMAVLGQIVGLVCIFIVVAVIRFALSIKRDGFCFRWNVVGMIAFAVVLLINGIFSEGYVVNNLIFGFLMALCFLGMFLLFHQCTISSKKLFLNLAFYMFVLSAVLIIELAVDYATIDGLVSNGIINRNLLMFGWGSYNTMGMLLTLCIPSVLYLAYRFKYGMFFTLYSVLIACAIFFSQSRQCIVFGAIIYFVCFALLLYAGHHKIINAFILVAFIATVLTLFFCDFNHFYSNVSLLFANFFDSFGNPNGSGRMTYWKTGIKDFSTSPIFGVGFYGSTIANYGWYGGYYTLFPRMYHNTVVQILASCGFVGFLAYAAHRTQSIISLFKRPTPERIYLAMVLLAFLLLNLVDVYIFTIISTLFYGAAVGILMRTEKL